MVRVKVHTKWQMWDVPLISEYMCIIWHQSQAFILKNNQNWFSGEECLLRCILFTLHWLMTATFPSHWDTCHLAEVKNEPVMLLWERLSLCFFVRMPNVSTVWTNVNTSLFFMALCLQTFTQGRVRDTLTPPGDVFVDLAVSALWCCCPPGSAEVGVKCCMRLSQG